MVYVNLVLARTLTFHLLVPQQQPNITPGFGVCSTVINVKNICSVLRQ